jgi:hypothetical protein
MLAVRLSASVLESFVVIVTLSLFTEQHKLPGLFAELINLCRLDIALRFRWPETARESATGVTHGII